MTPCEYTFMTDKLRALFHSIGFMEVNTQGRLSTLVACEDPTTMTLFSHGGKTWPLPQSGQYWLERELLSAPLGPRGYFCLTTSYRNEHSPEERHDGIFPMIEYATRGGLFALENVQKKVLDEFGFNKHYHSGRYPSGECDDQSGVLADAARREANLRQQHGPVCFLRGARTPTPFWNAQRVDVVLHGIETISGAARLCSARDMRRAFYTMSNGHYSKTLFSHFTRERVEAELDEYLSLPMVERSGGGIGLTRLLRALRQSGLDHSVPYPIPVYTGDERSDDDDDDDDGARVCNVTTVFERVVVDRVNSNHDLQNLQRDAATK